ncbi:DUF503 domain-containing protein [Tyzzerella sp. OttesenSCG-928-J15]|nr:DUF503 domain-containing protein [Tyzzerella sp. OttesenSCG-928-J15]
MFVGCCTFYLSINWAKSLKDKRRCIKSIMDKMKNKFNISVAEIGENDVHTAACIGFSCVSNSKAHLDSMMENILSFVENNTEAEIYNIEMEII